MLQGKKILLGITGSIAAYKAAFLIRLLVKEGADVRVVMTPLAKEFITPLTLGTLSGHPVESELFARESGEWANHVDLGMWADMYLVAPVTANSLAKMTSGQADNLLLTVFLSARCPVMVAPAMDMDMFNHFTTWRNLELLRQNGVVVLDAPEGDLASGLKGKGRMAEPEQIVEEVVRFFKKKPATMPLTGKKVLITAGPTYEAIDPVRFIGNYSSGKMGIALAESLSGAGAEVHLVLGPVSLKTENPDIIVYPVTSANEMYEKSVSLFPGMSGAIMAAAVSDFTPAETFREKTKRGKEDLVLKLKPTRDIALQLGKMKKAPQWLVGFALETEKEVENAKLKLQKKNLDIIVLNSLRDEGAGFGHNTNKISVIYRTGRTINYPLKSKTAVADDILQAILDLKGSKK